MSTIPQLSVVLVVDHQRARGACALGSVLGQSIASSLEVLLIDLGAGEHSPLPGCEHPSVRVVVEQRTRPYGEVLARAVHEARGPVIAFVEEHVLVMPGWAEALVRAHQGSWSAVCGEMHPGDLERHDARLVELVSRHEWSPPARRGEALVLRWQNVSYKREVLLSYGKATLPLLLASEGTLFRQLRRDRHLLYVEPDAKLIHAHEVRWTDFLRGSYYSNRSSTAADAAFLNLGAAGRLVRALAAMAGVVRWPIVLMRRTRRLPDADHWVRFARANVHRVFQYYVVLAVASLVGLVVGAGDSAVRFLDYEVNGPRHRPDVVPRATAY